jgi:hypothetical protein
MSADLNWVAIYSNPESNPPFELYCGDCGQAPTSWNPQGLGWRAFEKIGTALAARARPRPRPAPALDPREIRY